MQVSVGGLYDFLLNRKKEDRGSDEEATAVQDGGGVGGLDSQAGMDERVPLVAPSTPENMRPGRVGMPWRRIRGISAYQRYDIQQVARWIEQVLPFSLLLLVVFIRQHLQGIKQDILSKFDEYCLATT